MGMLASMERNLLWLKMDCRGKQGVGSIYILGRIYCHGGEEL